MTSKIKIMLRTVIVTAAAAFFAAAEDTVTAETSQTSSATASEAATAISAATPPTTTPSTTSSLTTSPTTDAPSAPSASSASTAAALRINVDGIENVVVIPVSGTIDHSMSAFITRGLRTAAERNSVISNNVINNNNNANDNRNNAVNNDNANVIANNNVINNNSNNAISNSNNTVNNNHNNNAISNSNNTVNNNHNNNTLVILDIDTFGGELGAALSIVDSVVAADVPTVAFVRSKAISAGALVAFAADMIVMRPNTTIGDVAPVINTSDGPKMLGEKHQSPIRAKFRTLARRNNYPEILSEAMVTEELAVLEITLPDTVLYLDSTRAAELDAETRAQIISSRTVVRAGELLTMTAEEAARYGFSSMTVNSVEDFLREVGIENAEIIIVEKNWSEGLVGIIAMLAPILMMIGLSALYIEIRSPGFGVPGAVGIICLATVFFGQYMVGLADYTEMILLIAGALLIAVEIFVTPGFGVVGFAGVALMIAGMVLSFQDFVMPSPELPWQAQMLRTNISRVAISVIGAVVFVILFFKYGFVRLSKVIKGPYLAETLSGASSDEGMMFVPKVGDTGVASTYLRPSGKALIDKNICDVVSDGMFIECGTHIVVTLVQGNRIVVAPKETGE